MRPWRCYPCYDYGLRALHFFTYHLDGDVFEPVSLQNPLLYRFAIDIKVAPLPEMVYLVL